MTETGKPGGGGGFDQLVKELREWLKRNKPSEVTSQAKSDDRIRLLPRAEIKFRGKSYYTPVGRESDDRKSSGKKQGPRCLFCDQPHVSSNCNDVKELAERRKYFKDNRLCFNCGIKFHQAGDFEKQGCAICKERHHTSLHDDSYCVRVTSYREAALPLVPFRVNRKVYWAVLDTAAGRNYISRTLSRDIKREPVEWVTKSLVTIHSEASPKRLPRYHFEIQSIEGEKFETDALAVSRENL